MRVRIFAVSVMVSAMMLAGVLVSAMPAIAPTFTPFPTDMPRTVNGTADAHSTASVVVPFPTLDPIYVTTSHIVAQATANAQATFYIANLDPIYTTATYIVERATQMHSASAIMTMTAGGFPDLFPTLTPTLSTQEKESLRTLWRDDLQNATGFSHPVFDYITYDLFTSCCVGEYSVADLDSHLPIEIERVTYQGDEYVAIIIHRIHYPPDSRFLMFRLRDGVPTIVVDQLYSYEIFSFSPSRNSENHPVGFSDRNGNELPDLTVDAISGGSCTWHRMILYEIGANGSVINLTPRVEGASFFKLVDLNQDEIVEIQVSARVNDIPLSSPVCHDIYLTRYFGWDGTAYSDMSADLDESYWPEIGLFEESLKSQDACILPDFGLINVLSAYEARGQLEEVWTNLQSELHWELCPPEVLIEQGEEIGKFLIWLGTHLKE